MALHKKLDKKDENYYAEHFLIAKNYFDYLANIQKRKAKEYGRV